MQSHLRVASFSHWRRGRALEAGHLGKIGVTSFPGVAVKPRENAHLRKIGFIIQGNGDGDGIILNDTAIGGRTSMALGNGKSDTVNIEAIISFDFGVMSPNHGP